MEQFDQFGYLNQIDGLAGGDLTKWDMILLMPYDQVYTKLKMNKLKASYEKKYEELYRIANGG